MLVNDAGWFSLPLSHEMVASGCPPAPSRIAVSASNTPCSPWSPLLQLSPPTTSWLAPGAMS